MKAGILIPTELVDSAKRASVTVFLPSTTESTKNTFKLRET